MILVPGGPSFGETPVTNGGLGMIWTLNQHLNRNKLKEEMRRRNFSHVKVIIGLSFGNHVLLIQNGNIQLRFSSILGSSLIIHRLKNMRLISISHNITR